jgi:hypothetical protein
VIRINHEIGKNWISTFAPEVTSDSSVTPWLGYQSLFPNFGFDPFLTRNEFRRFEIPATIFNTPMVVEEVNFEQIAADEPVFAPLARKPRQQNELQLTAFDDREFETNNFATEASVQGGGNSRHEVANQEG